jgi:hypothetical protein
VGGGEKRGKKKEKRNGEGVYGEKKKGEEKNKKLKGKKLIGFICLFILFDVKCRIVKIYLEKVYDIFFLL